jgi:hypothetical protein
MVQLCDVHSAPVPVRSARNLEAAIWNAVALYKRSLYIKRWGNASASTITTTALRAVSFRRDMMRLRVVREQVKEIEQQRLEFLAKTVSQVPPTILL